MLRSRSDTVAREWSPTLGLLSLRVARVASAALACSIRTMQTAESGGSSASGTTGSAGRGKRSLKMAIRNGVVSVGAPLIRAYMQGPVHWGKRPFWERVGERFFWQHLPFETKTEFGAIIRGNTGDFIPSAIYYFGVWEPHLTRFIQDRLLPGDVFVDVGANIGYYTLWASKLTGSTGRVVAIEASARIYHTLLEHLALNHADNVRPVHCAVSDVEGVLPVFTGPGYNSGRTTTVPKEDQPTSEGEVRAAPLPSLLSADEMARARIVKVDVEGAEWAVAQGMRPLLSACREDLEIVIEVSPDRLAEQGHSVAEIFELFLNHGFRAYRIENDYEMISYVPPVANKPIVRIAHTDVTEQMDIVFSRVDRASL
jgi:FkbM family methyltransferase